MSPASPPPTTMTRLTCPDSLRVLPLLAMLCSRLPPARWSPGSPSRGPSRFWRAWRARNRRRPVRGDLRRHARGGATRSRSRRSCSPRRRRGVRPPLPTPTRAPLAPAWRVRRRRRDERPDRHREVEDRRRDPQRGTRSAIHGTPCHVDDRCALTTSKSDPLAIAPIHPRAGSSTTCPSTKASITSAAPRRSRGSHVGRLRRSRSRDRRGTRRSRRETRAAGGRGAPARPSSLGSARKCDRTASPIDRGGRRQQMDRRRTRRAARAREREQLPRSRVSRSSSRASARTGVADGASGPRVARSPLT